MPLIDNLPHDAVVFRPLKCSVGRLRFNMMESMKNVFRFVVGSLAVAGVLALIRGWSKVPDYLLMIVGMAIVWAASELFREWIRKRRSTREP